MGSEIIRTVQKALSRGAFYPTASILAMPLRMATGGKFAVRASTLSSLSLPRPASTWGFLLAVVLRNLPGKLRRRAFASNDRRRENQHEQRVLQNSLRSRASLGAATWAVLLHVTSASRPLCGCVRAHGCEALP